jgi:hypothetical protein
VDGSLNRDQVLDELEFLLTVEHALIVEYLSVCCALGHDLATADGGPPTQSGRDAATAAFALAADEMLRVHQLVRALSAFRATVQFSRARAIMNAAGTEIPLGPPSREQLEHLLDREESIAAAVDKRYTQLSSSVTDPKADAFSDDLRAAVQRGTTHGNAVTVLREHLSRGPVAGLLRATRRFGRTDTERVLLRASDRTYRLLLGLLEAHFRNLDGDDEGIYRLLALSAMDIMNDVNRALVHDGLLPPFEMPA